MIFKSFQLDKPNLIGELKLEEQNQSIKYQVQKYLNIIHYCVSPNMLYLSIFENKFCGQMINCPKNNKQKIKRLKIKIFEINNWQIIFQGYLKYNAHLKIFQKYSQDSNFLICYGGEEILIVDIKKQKEYVIEDSQQKFALFTFDIKNNFYIQKDGNLIQLTLENDKWNQKQISYNQDNMEIKYLQVLDNNCALIVKSQFQQIILRINLKVINSRKVIMQSNKPEILIYNNFVMEMHSNTSKNKIYYIRQLKNGKIFRKGIVCDNNNYTIYLNQNGLFNISTLRLQQNLYELSSFDILLGHYIKRRMNSLLFKSMETYLQCQINLEQYQDVFAQIDDQNEISRNQIYILYLFIY